MSSTKQNHDEKETTINTAQNRSETVAVDIRNEIIAKYFPSIDNAQGKLIQPPLVNILFGTPTYSSRDGANTFLQQLSRVNFETETTSDNLSERKKYKPRKKKTSKNKPTEQ